MAQLNPDTRMLSQADALALAYVVVQHVATRLRIRVLAIKGPTLQAHGLRAARVSADADLLVDPATFHLLCQELESYGWHQRVELDAPRVLVSHSATYIHENWPCDVDIHHSFPGFFSDSQTVFEHLWRTRCVQNWSRLSIVAPSKASSAVIAILHGLRSPANPRLQDEMQELVNKIQQGFSAQDLAEFRDVATEGAALWVLRSQLEQLGIQYHNADITAEQQRSWNMRLEYDGLGSMIWIHSIRTSPFSAWPRMLWRAVWVSRDMVPRNDPTDKPSVVELLRYQFARWRRGVRSVNSFRKGRRD